MPRARIGVVACPACAIDADVRQAASGYVYVQCDDCSLQMFARSARSDKLIRSKMRTEKAAAPASTPAAPAAPAKPKKEAPVKRPAPKHESILEEGDHEKADKSIWD